MALPDPLLQWRSEFSILDRTVYMISHSLGAMPRRTRDRLKQYADEWDIRGVRAWEEGWWEMPITIGDLIGKIIGAQPRTVVMHQNVSICQAIVLSCFDWSAQRNKVVSEEMNFSTNLYLYQQFGGRLVTVPSPDHVTMPLDRMLAAIDEETALVSASHVCFRSSYIQDLDAITRRAHEVGAMVVADLYQSAGTVPVNVEKLGVDFATGGSVKWLCGGPGAGYLYVRPDLIDRLKPRLTGWAAHREPFSFSMEHEYAPGIARFLNGTPNVPAMYAARSGYEIVHEAGVENIRAKSMRQTARLVELAEDAGFKVNSPKNPAERGGTVSIDVPDGYAVNKELSRRDFLADFRPGAGIRVAPHFYSKDEELDLIVREIRKIVDAN